MILADTLDLDSQWYKIIIFEKILGLYSLVSIKRRDLLSIKTINLERFLLSASYDSNLNLYA